jgi:hypothetical protein
VKDNFNLKIVKTILYGFSSFEPLNIRALAITVAFVNFLPSLTYPGEGAGSRDCEHYEDKNIYSFHIFSDVMMK